MEKQSTDERPIIASFDGVEDQKKESAVLCQQHQLFRVRNQLGTTSSCHSRNSKPEKPSSKSTESWPETLNTKGFTPSFQPLPNGNMHRRCGY